MPGQCNHVAGACNCLPSVEDAPRGEPVQAKFEADEARLRHEKEQVKHRHPGDLRREQESIREERVKALEDARKLLAAGTATAPYITAIDIIRIAEWIKYGHTDV